MAAKARHTSIVTPAIIVFCQKGEQTFRISPVLISECVTSLCEAVRASLGIAVISEWAIREDIRSGRLVRVLPQWNAKEFTAYVVYPGHRALPARVRAFIDFAV
jgi:DNA-binding transcriptional LysR family regulator